jgi:Zn-dependent protease with chaperone function
MNFYHAQDEARKQTFWLVSLVSIAVFTLVLLTNLVVAIFIWYSDPASLLNAHPSIDSATGLDKLMAIIQALGWQKAAWIALLVCGTISMAIGFKWWDLRDGGASVAESLGGKRVLTNTDSARERQLLNVVEEMALAAGVPVPPVYLMHSEQGINAFAAGLSLKDAVIGVSQGACDYLNREQLQGVVAHEFSHILNGDMRLNLKIIAVLHGIVMIGESGLTLFRLSSRRSYGVSYRSSSRRDNKGLGAIVLLGVALIVIGWLGQFFGSLIKAGVSRQREFLADASAVQFTRNPEGIGGALRLIGGHTQRSSVQHAKAHEMGHLFFSQAFDSRWFATHPPLEDRIRKVLPGWRGDYLSPQRAEPESAPIDPMQKLRDDLAPVAALAGASLLGQHDSSFTSEKAHQSAPNDVTVGLNEFTGSVDETIPEFLLKQAQEPLGAAAIVLALLLDRDEKVRQKQRALFEGTWNRNVTLIDACEAHTRILSLDSILPLIERLLSALKSLSKGQYQSLRETMPVLIRCDGRVDILEWVIFELVRQHGDRHFGLSRDAKPKYKKAAQIAKLYAIVASRIAYCDSVDDNSRIKAFGKATNLAGVYSENLLSEEQCSGATFTRAIHELNKCYPLLKPRLLKGLVQAAQQNDQLHPQERLLISTIALIWDCPVEGV